MPPEILTIEIGDDEEVAGYDYVADKDNDQIVTFIPDDDDFDESHFVIEFFGTGNPTNPLSGPGGDDRFNIDLSLFENDFSMGVKSMDSGDIFAISNWDTRDVTGTVYTFTYTGADGDTHTFSIDAQSTNGKNGVDVVQVICFTRGTRILTPDGEKPIEDLAADDQVVCGDGITRPIRWIGSRKLDVATLKQKPDLAPVRFAANALGTDKPSRDLLLSPQHAVLLTDWRAELLFGEHEVLVPAKHLTNDLMIRQVPVTEDVEYFHILLDTHATVLAEGCECETLFPGYLTSHAVSGAARAEIIEIFPELAGDLSNFGQEYRTTLRRHEAQALMDAPTGT